MTILLWFSVAFAILLFAWGFLQMRNGITPLDAYIGFYKMIGAFLLVIVLLIVFVVGAMASPRDGFISVMEATFGMLPGGTRVVPQCSCSIEYLGTRAQGRGVYAIYVKKLD